MKRGSSIFYGALLLTGTNFLLRLAGMSFQVYLSGRIGAAGVGLLQLIVSVRALAFAAGSAGIRTGTLCLCAEALGRKRPLSPVLSGCLKYGLLFSVPTAAGLWLLSPRLAAEWIGDMAALPSLRASAWFLPVLCLLGVMTALFSAAGRLRTLVAVEFLEQGCAIAVTFLLLSRWSGTGSACLAVTLGGGCSAALSLWILWLLRRTGPRTASPPYRRIFTMALPVGAADSLRVGLNTLENFLVPRRLALFGGAASAMANYGVLHGMVFPVLMFPAAILASLAELLAPELSRCAHRQGRVRVRYLTRQGLRAAFLFGVCMGGVLFAAGRPLGQLLYRSETAGIYIRLYAPLVPMLYADGIVDAMCKGLGRHSANARYNLFTSLLDVILLWFLLPRYGMAGCYFSFAAVHLVNFALSLRRLVRTAELRLSPLPAGKALLCAAAAAFLTGRLLPAEEAGVPAAAAAYLLALWTLWLVFRVVGRQDWLWLRGMLFQ